MDIHNESANAVTGGWAPRPSISYSSLHIYDQCPRAWLHRYEPNLLPPDMRAAARIEGRLSPTAALAGTVVDAVITDALYRWHEDGERPCDLFPKARRELREILLFSRVWTKVIRAGGIPHRGNRQPVAAEYYSDGWPNERKAEILRNIEMCLRNFESGEILDDLDRYSRDAWCLPPRDACPWFVWSGTPVYAKWDFALSSPKTTIIYDWKCGRPHDGVTTQLYIYAAYAMTAWNARRDGIRLIPVWLQTGMAESRSVSRKVLKTVEDLVLVRHRELIEAVRATRNRDALEVFPMAENSSACRGCTFRSCEGYGRHVEAHSDAFRVDYVIVNEAGPGS